MMVSGESEDVILDSSMWFGDVSDMHASATRLLMAGDYGVLSMHAVCTPYRRSKNKSAPIRRLQKPC